MTLDGDVGARHLIAKHAEAVAEVPVEGDGAFLDIDTPQALEAARRQLGAVAWALPYGVECASDILCVSHLPFTKCETSLRPLISSR